MPDMGSFVGIDVRVFNDDFVALLSLAGRCHVAKCCTAKCAPVETHVDIAVPGNLNGGNAWQIGQTFRNLTRDLARRLPQLARKLKGNRNSKFAKRVLLRLFKRNFRPDIVLRRQTSFNLLDQSFFDVLEH